ncbi:MAG: hypothetical protein FGM26_13600 [Beijerinckiaceae bacterium]|nr:hypothetical protein [Beijerinckiaceae bacterium]
MPKATLLVSEKTSYPDGTIMQMVVWSLPKSDPERPHGLKYSLFFGLKGKRLVDYDNERGKGDHKHIGPFEVPYKFQSLPRLFADFEDDVRRARDKL